MFVIIYRYPDPKNNCYYCSYNSICIHPDEVWKRFGEPGSIPKIFSTRHEAENYLHEWVIEGSPAEVIPCPPEWLTAELRHKMIGSICKLIDILTG